MSDKKPEPINKDDTHADDPQQNPPKVEQEQEALKVSDRFETGKDPGREEAADSAKRLMDEQAEHRANRDQPYDNRFEGTPAAGQALSDSTPRGTVLRDVTNPSNASVYQGDRGNNPNDRHEEKDIVDPNRPIPGSVPIQNLDGSVSASAADTKDAILAREQSEQVPDMVTSGPVKVMNENEPEPRLEKKPEETAAPVQQLQPGPSDQPKPAA